MQQRKSLLPYLTGVMYATIFGFSFLVTKNILDQMDPFHFLGLRFSLAVIVMSVLILFRVFKVDFRGKNVKLLMLLGLLQPISYFTCETYGVQLITSSQVGMMIALIPVFVAIFSAVFLKEYVNKIQILCIIASVGGVIFMVLMQGGTGGEFNLFGYLAILGAVMSAAAFNVSSRKLAKTFSPIEKTYIMMWMGAILFNILGFIQYKQVGRYASYIEPLFDIAVIPPMLYLALLSSIVAFVLVNFTLGHLPATQASLFANLVTIIAIIAGVIFRGEIFQWYHFIGGIMIIGGVFGINRFSDANAALPEEVVI